MGSNYAIQKKEHPRTTRANEREWVVVVLTNGRGRPSHRSGRLTLAEAEQRAAKLKGEAPTDTVGVAHRPPAAPAPGRTRRYCCSRCRATVEAKRQPRKCESCGLNERPRSIEAQHADRAVA